MVMGDVLRTMDRGDASIDWPGGRGEVFGFVGAVSRGGFARDHVGFEKRKEHFSDFAFLFRL